jgi:hypothetical protein
MNTRRCPRNRFADPPATEVEGLVRRAKRFSKRGDQRRAMLALREASFATRSDARLWTLYGVQCVRAGRSDEAIHALKQATWLRERARDDGRARSTRALLQQVEAGQMTLPLKAA